MNYLKITAKIRIYNYEELLFEEKNIVDKAKEAVFRAYAPYSGFKVGAAALMENGEIITGNNQENIAFPSGLCAERTTLFYAHSQYPGEAVRALAVAAHTKGDFIDRPISPCGACRQVMLETEMRFRRRVKVILYGKKEIYIIENIKDLLPLAFDQDFSFDNCL
ncbi:MAG: cytidine deaminase [Dysgonamonadaceae bacterium]|jgi:cytidine deaminase|nr:cytidine deaminase [Dysgonamonadaceae bacterium]